MDVLYGSNYTDLYMCIYIYMDHVRITSYIYIYGLYMINYIENGVYWDILGSILGSYGVAIMDILKKPWALVDIFSAVASVGTGPHSGDRWDWHSEHRSGSVWLVGDWNMTGWFFQKSWEYIIIPIDELIFFRGVPSTRWVSLAFLCFLHLLRVPERVVNTW